MSKRVQTLLEHYFAINNHWPIGPRQAQKIVKHVANKARLSQRVTPHSLRRTFATLALQKETSLAAVKKILGRDRLSRWNVAERATSRNDGILYNSNEELFKHMVLHDLGLID